MDASELIRAGRLEDARKRAAEEVKSSPADIVKRTLLIQILAFCGEWDKAERHLEAVSSQDPTRETGVQIYRNLIRAEKERLQVVRQNARPSFLPMPPAYLEALGVAWQKVMKGSTEQAEALFNELYKQIPLIKGNLNGLPFEGLRDTDTALAFFLEAYVHDRYVRLPFEAVRELAIPPAQNLLDLLWAPALITTWEGLTLNSYLPVLYPESFRHVDDRIKLGRMTDWTSLGGTFARGAGQHVLQAGPNEWALLDIREVEFAPAASGESGEKAD
jgi:type VI secretion system protein ImpE